MFIHLIGELFRRSANIGNHRRPHHPFLCSDNKICRVLLLVLAVGSFSSLITFQVRFSYLKPIPYTSFVRFISPTSTPHSISGSGSPCHKSTHVIPLRFTAAFSTHRRNPCHFGQEFHQSTHNKQPISLHFIPNALCHSVSSPPMLKIHAYQWYIFFHCDEFTPTKTTKTPPPTICAVNKNSSS